MADKDDKKSKEQLIREIDALRQQLAEQQGDTGLDASGKSTEPSLARPISRRDALSKWIAPLVLSIPLTTGLGARTAQAQLLPPPSGGLPPPSGGLPPPSGLPPPTAPTAPPTGLPPPSAPTAPPAAPPVKPEAVDTLGVSGAVVLGGALAAAGAKMFNDKKKGSGQDKP